MQTTDWELYIAQIAAEILAEQSPKRLLQVRGRIYELLVNCIPPTLIFQTLCFYLSKRLDVEMKHEVIRWAAQFEHKLQLGSKAIMHIEAFIAQFMATYKRKLISAFAQFYFDREIEWMNEWMNAGGVWRMHVYALNSNSTKFCASWSYENNNNNNNKDKVLLKELQ